jgi:hypothetical protein
VITVTVLFCLPGLPVELNEVLIVVDLPGFTVVSVGVAAVHPQDAFTLRISKSVFPSLVNLKSKSALSPSLMVLKSNSFVSKFALGALAFCSGVNCVKSSSMVALTEIRLLASNFPSRIKSVLVRSLVLQPLGAFLGRSSDDFTNVIALEPVPWLMRADLPIPCRSTPRRVSCAPSRFWPAGPLGGCDPSRTRRCVLVVQ